MIAEFPLFLAFKLQIVNVLALRNPLFLKHLILISFLALSCPFFSVAQYKSERDATIPLEHFYIERQKGGALRLLLSKLHFSLSTGYGNMMVQHRLDSFGILQEPDSVPKIFDYKNVNLRYGNWINTLSQNTYPIAPGSFMVNSDTAQIGFKSVAMNIPFQGTVHIEIDRYRIGGGYSIEYTHFGPFTPISYDDQIGSLPSPVQSLFMKKYFGLIGGTFYRYYQYTAEGDVRIGGYKLGNQFDGSLIKRGTFYNIGVAARRDLSEYFSVFVRPSYEIKSYKLSVPENGQVITHRLNAWSVQIGATYRLPELRRCPLKDCHAQINHAHGNREYRSRRHPIWKKQNPHYGENYPTLLKYKGGNKRKLNPY